MENEPKQFDIDATLSECKRMAGRLHDSIIYIQLFNSPNSIDSKKRVLKDDFIPDTLKHIENLIEMLPILTSTLIIIRDHCENELSAKED